MKCLILLRIAFMLFFFTTYNNNSFAQNSEEQNDSTKKRIILIVRPGYYDQSSTYNTPSNKSLPTNNSSPNNNIVKKSVKKKTSANSTSFNTPIPYNDSSAPTYAPSAPASMPAVPTHVSGVQNHVSAAPAHVPAESTHVSAVPNQVSVAPAHVPAASTYVPSASTSSERTGIPDYMHAVAKKHVTVAQSPPTTIPIKAITINSGSTIVLNGIDTTQLSKINNSKKDTVLLTKTDTITKITPKHKSNKILFLELGGPGLAISLNYDQRFTVGKVGWGYRVGIGYFGDGGNTVFTIPLQINYIVGTDGKYFEFGAGTTFLNTTGDNTGKTFIFDRVTGFIGTATIGVRYEPAKSLNFRLGFVPLFSNNEIIYAGGFSIGYTF